MDRSHARLNFTNMTAKEFFRKAFSGYLWGNCLGMVVFVAVLLFGAFFFMNFYTNHGVSVKVPNVVGKNVNVVEDQFRDLGLDLLVVDTGYVKTLPADIILRQTVRPGALVKPGRVVQVTINSAHAKTLALPDVADNSSYRDAESQLKVMGFRLTEPKYTAGDRDWVYSVEMNGKVVRAGDRIPVDQPITLVVGDGRVFEVFNGDDSLDHVLNADMYEMDDEEPEVDEGVQ